MKSIKRLVSVALCTIILLNVSGCSGGGYFEFKSLGDNTASVSANYYCSKVEKELVIPSTSPKGEKVVTIEQLYHPLNEEIESVVIPDGVTTIGCVAFGWNFKNLKKVSIPNSVTKIDLRAFRDCGSLTSIEIPDSVTYIGQGAFSDCKSLTEIKIPDGVTFIGADTFNRCESLTSIVIPNSVTKIESAAFSNCTSLKSIEIPDSVTTLNTFIFTGCNSLTSINGMSPEEYFRSRGLNPSDYLS